jgi:hypothetical protein
MYAPIDGILQGLEQRGFCTKNGTPAAKGTWSHKENHRYSLTMEKRFDSVYRIRI